MNLGKFGGETILGTFGTRWKMGRNGDQKWKLQAEIYILVGVAWKKDKKNDTKIAGISKKTTFKHT